MVSSPKITCYKTPLLGRLDMLRNLENLQSRDLKKNGSVLNHKIAKELYIFFNKIRNFPNVFIYFLN